MALYVLSDTHLSGATEKPMDIFGERWKNHTERIGYFFEKTLRTGDTVVIPGDISWGMTLEEALPDLQFLNSLPGKKILMKGNHDYWWSTVSKIEKFFAEHQLSTLSLLFNNAYKVESFALCGTRGWYSDSTNPPCTARAKIVLREAGRLERSLQAGRQLEAEELLAFLHFPPVWGSFVCRELLEVLLRYGVKRCYFGHMHGQYNLAPTFEYEGISFTLASSDYLQFRPLSIV